MKSICTLAVLWIFAACSSTRPTTMTSTGANQAMAEPADSIVYYKTTFDVEQKDYLPQMLGTWVVQTMQRQTKLPEETLNVSFRLNEDKTYVIGTSCGEVKGTYSVKGVSIKFIDAAYNRNNCAGTEQLDEMVRLLTNTVSMYTVNGNMLFLKDNSSNNLFRITR